MSANPSISSRRFLGKDNHLVLLVKIYNKKLQHSHQATGLSVVTITGNLVGAFSAAMVGSLIDAKGYNSAFLIIAGTVFLVTFLVFTVMGDGARYVGQLMQNIF
jgi:hypothetical protein